MTAFPNIDLFDKNIIHIASESKFEFIETKEGGEGICFFESNDKVLILKAHNNPPLIWSLRNKKCAEGAFLVIRKDGTLELHILEMKSKLTHREFTKVLAQWSGMYLSALAILGIIQMKLPDKVFLYIAFKQDCVNQIDSRDPIFLKSQVGGASLPGVEEWSSNQVSLHHNITAHIVKKQRDPVNCNFGLI